MKRTGVKPLIRRDLIKARRIVHFRTYKDKIVYASKWPKRRGPAMSPVQKAWIDRFIEWAHNSKQPDPCAVATAATLTPNTGFWPRDVIHYAGAGKLLHMGSPSGMTSPLPYLFAHPPSTKYEGAPRVITPTVNVSQSANFSYPSAVFVAIQPTVKEWDNNAFWDGTGAPKRLTARATGLYQLNAQVLGYSGGGVDVFLEVRKNGGSAVLYAHDSGSAFFSAVANVNSPIYLSAGDYLELWFVGLPAGNYYKLITWSLMAITPETII